jgi:hypothetical protein
MNITPEFRWICLNVFLNRFYTVCPRIGFTRGNNYLFLILRKIFRGITFFASFEIPISVIKISVLIYCTLKLTFCVKIWTFFMLYILLQLASFFDKQLITFFKVQRWTGFRHVITKLNEKLLCTTHGCSEA